MKTILKYAAVLTAIALAGEGCTKKFDSINSNPNQSTSSNAAWLATNMITSITSSDISIQKTFVQPFMLSKYALWAEGQENIQYNKLGRTNFDRMDKLRNVAPMLAYAESLPEDVKNSYTALAHFIRAWQFFQVTMQVGDIPYSEAIKGESAGIIKPKYDTQKEVFAGILNELDTANTLFASGGDFDGDFIYGGKAAQWRKLVNGFELHVLTQLYKKTADADLNVIARFKDIVANRPLMEGYQDNFAVTYINSAGYCYPWSSTPVQTNPSIIYSIVSSTLIDQLKTLKDNRLFYYAEPSAKKISAGSAVSDWDAYVGVESSDVYSDTKSARASGNFSDFNLRYKVLYNAEPVGLFNYWDQEFILAEAVVRGWISGSAQTYYEAGIKGSMKFLANYTTDTYTHEMGITDAYIATYQSSVALKGSMENQINQVISQKYLAGFFQNVDYNAWYENRRTGYPAFKLNPSTNLNTPNTQFPVRWLYPSDELDYNPDNVAKAIESQYGGNDNVNELMWILK